MIDVITMSKKDSLSEEDKTLFRDSLKGVRRLKHDRVEAEKPKGRQKRSSSEPDESNIDHRFLTDPDELEEIAAGDVLFFSRGGIQHRQLKKLKTGQLPIEAILDLHGHTRMEAADLLSDFLSQCFDDQLSCVRVIHGKGTSNTTYKSILKSLTKRWLEQTDFVLAFASAPARDGGTGAVNILLKKNRL